MWINSCLSHIIYRLVASPSRFEIGRLLLEAVVWQLISFVKVSFFMKIEMIFSFMFMPRNSRMRGLRNPYCGMLDAL